MAFTRTLFALLLAAPLAAAQEPAPQPNPPAPQPAPAAKAQRDAHLKALKEATVHFDFPRARLPEVLKALEKATGVPCTIGERGAKALERRKFKLKYVADRRGDLVLTDLAKAAALDVVVTADGALFDLPKQIDKVRRRLGLPRRSVRPQAADVAKMLDTKQLSLVSREKPLRVVLKFLREETGVPFVLAAKDRAEDPVTFRVTGTPFRQVLDKVCQPLGLDWLRQGNVILVDTAEAIARQRPDDDDANDGADDEQED
jgi:hypothetical protein